MTALRIAAQIGSNRRPSPPVREGMRATQLLLLSLSLSLLPGCMFTGLADHLVEPRERPFAAFWEPTARSGGEGPLELAVRVEAVDGSGLHTLQRFTAPEWPSAAAAASPEVRFAPAPGFCCRLFPGSLTAPDEAVDVLVELRDGERWLPIGSFAPPREPVSGWRKVLYAVTLPVAVILDVALFPLEAAALAVALALD